MDEQKHLVSQDVGAFGGKAALSYPSVEGLLYFSTGAALSKTAVAPIDRVKLLLQNQRGMIIEGRLSEPYKGIRNCLWRTTMEEGFASLWRGNVTNLIRYVPAQALNFGLWDFYKSKFREIGFGKDEVGNLLWCYGNMSAGLLAGFSSVAFVYPMDYARTRLAIDTKMGGGWQYKGLVDLCRKTLAADGVAGFYRGFSFSSFGVAGYRGIYFGMYESLKPVVLTGNYLQDSFSGSFALAWASATVAGSAVYLYDTSRRRMMMMSGESKGLVASAKQLGVDNMRLRDAFRGVGVNIPRAVVGAAMLAAYDRASTHSLTHAFTM